MNEKGTLYLVATPIGNLEDITHRALRVLSEVDLIAAEDTRQTLKLLNHFNIKKPLVSYYEHNKVEKGNQLIIRLLEGRNIALVSDAGTPGISDPGEDLVALAIENDVDITMVPGPAAVIAGLILSGLPAGRFAFEGFLPINKRARKERMAQLKKECRTIVLYEAPHKLLFTLKDLKEELDPRKIVLARELTKKFEEVIRCSSIAEALERFEAAPPRGEFVLILEGAPQEQQQELNRFWQAMSLEQHLEYYMKLDMDKKTAMKKVAEDRGLSKREIYSGLLEEKGMI